MSSLMRPVMACTRMVSSNLTCYPLLETTLLNDSLGTLLVSWQCVMAVMVPIDNIDQRE